jgi:hypothetical protein
LPLEGVRTDVRTIAHDVEQSLSFYYYLIDRWVLSAPSA